VPNLDATFESCVPAMRYRCPYDAAVSRQVQDPAI